MLQNISDSKNAILLNFIFIKESWKKMYYGYHKNSMQHNSF